MKAIIYFFILGLFITSTIHAQSRIGGEILIENSKPASGAIIRLMALDSITMKKFSATNEFGKWHINVDSGQYILNAKYLGYKDYYQKIAVGQNDSLSFNITLTSDVVLLSGAEVVGDAIGITRKGDTLKFNIEHFKSGYEYSLGDVLNQLPGIKVDASGNVIYNGKKVDKLLVEGKDILKGKQKMATEGIRADQLSGIHVINDYKDAKDISTEKSNKIALDVKIKKSEQGKWSGQITALGGYKNRYEGNLSVLNISKKIGISIFAKSNNNGEKIMSIMDLLSLHQGMIQLGPNYGFDDAMPKGINISPQTNKNLDGIIAGSFDYTINKKHSLVGDVLLANIQRQEKTSYAEYFNNKDIKIGDNLKKINLPIINWSLKSKSKYNNKLSSKFLFLGNWRIENENENSIGKFNTTSFSYQNANRQKNNLINPSFKINYNPAKNIMLTWRSSYSIHQSQSNLNLSDTSPFLGLNLKAVENIYHFYQNNTTNSNNFSNQIQFTYKLKKGFAFKVKSDGGINSISKTYESPIDSLNFAGQVNINQKFLNNELLLTLDTTHWEVKTGCIIYQSKMQIDNDDAILPIQIRPTASFKYLFSDDHYILAKANVTNKPIKLGYGNPITEIINTRQTQSFDIDWKNISYAQNFSLIYSNFKLPSGRIINGNIRYSILKNQIGTNLTATPAYTQINLIRISEQKTFQYSFMYRSKLRLLKIIPIIRFSGSFDRGKSVYEGNFTDYNQDSHTIHISIKSKWKRAFNYKLGYALSYTHQSQGSDIQYSFISHSPNLRLIYKFKNGLTWKNKISYQIFNGSFSSLDNLKLDLDINYKIKNSPFRFFVKGRNLTNWAANKEIITIFNTFSYAEISYFSFPGYILGGLSYQF